MGLPFSFVLAPVCGTRVGLVGWLVGWLVDRSVGFGGGRRALGRVRRLPRPARGLYGAGQAPVRFGDCRYRALPDLAHTRA
jgi:hypothetical protein